MKPTSLIRTLKTCIAANRPAMIISHPGMGKSQIVRAVAEQMALKLYDVRLSGRDPVDLLGLPRIENNVTRWCTPAILPQAGPALLFLDEMNRAQQMVLNVGLQLVLDRRVGDYVLPEGVSIVAAGNPETDPGVTKMSAAMKLRFVHLHLEISPDDWLQYALKSGIDPVVMAWIQFRPDLLHAFDAKALNSPNPRGWEFISDIIKQEPDADVEHEIYAGIVGEATAIEFSGFKRLQRELPQIPTILLDPKKAKVPTEPSALYAISAALARRASESNLGRVLTYLERLPKEFNVLCVKMLVARLADAITSTPEYTRWTVAHADVTF